MEAKKEVLPTAEAGGARVEAHLDTYELAKLDALVASGVVGSRQAALKYLVGLLSTPKLNMQKSQEKQQQRQSTTDKKTWLNDRSGIDWFD